MTDISAAVVDFAATVPDGSTVLDVGCGLRPYEKHFSGQKYVGIDVPDSGRDAHGKRPDFEFDGVYIPLPDASVDAIICNEVLEHAVDPDRLIPEMFRVLRSGGKMLVTVPFIWGLHELPYDFRRYTIIGIRKAAESAGFRVAEVTKLTEGVRAIQLLVKSETSYHLNHGAVDNGTGRRLYRWLAEQLFRGCIFLWRRSLRFERIYIDNLMICEKP
jgi:SAM-dependent methyltransferase